jgi:cysteine protease ATG4
MAIDGCRPVAIVPPAEHDTIVDSPPREFDICREYGYKYEYTEDGQSDDDECYDEEQQLASQHLLQQPGNDVPLLFQDVANDDVPKLDHNGNIIQNPPKAYLLGRRYDYLGDVSLRRSDESSLLWFTYRCDFPEIAPYGITTDAGWGCMLRSAQMLLGQALRMHFRDRNWRPPRSLVQCRSDEMMTDIMTWFADFPSNNESFYSLHNMVAAGVSRYEKLPGEWYGPGTACQVLRDLCELHYRHMLMEERRRRKAQQAEEYYTTDPSSESKKEANELFRPMLRVYVAQQGSVYRDAVDEIMTRDGRALQKLEREKKGDPKQENAENDGDAIDIHDDPLRFLMNAPVETNEAAEIPWDTSLLLMVPLRLGLKNFNAKAYGISLAHTFSFPQSVGFVGGSPRHALWFYGASSNGTKIYGLDPHTVQSAPYRKRSNNEKSGVSISDDYLRSVRCANPPAIDMNRIDPSLALAFYCRDRADFDDLCQSFADMKSDSFRKIHGKTKNNMPELFSIADAIPDYNADVSSAMAEMMMSSSPSNDVADFEDETDDETDDDDEYVML